MYIDMSTEQAKHILKCAWNKATDKLMTIELC